MTSKTDAERFVKFGKSEEQKRILKIIDKSKCIVENGKCYCSNLIELRAKIKGDAK